MSLMVVRLLPWSLRRLFRSPLRGGGTWRRPALEWLEHRTLFSASSPPGAGPLASIPAQVAHVLPSLDADPVGTVLSPNQVDIYEFTVPTTPGAGELTATITVTSGTLLPRLTLSGPAGQLLIQSDSERLVQFLQPGA